MKSWIVALAAALALASQSLALRRQGVQPWQSPAGQACFERWIEQAMRRLNDYDGSEEFNSRKPWRINQHGLVEGNERYGPRASGPPADWARHENKYHWMWEHYLVDAEAKWRAPDWNGAQVPPLRDYVLRCLEGGALPQDTVRTLTLQVAADRAWTSTGIELRAGDVVRIEATGVVEASASDDARTLFHRVPPEGRPEFQPNLPQPLLPALVMLGRIGDGPVLPIGRLVTRLAAGAPYGTGTLSLGINDDVLGDNSGAWTVTITVLAPDDK
ncbi:MAG: hypothetical protein U1E76_06950 [Planctomycetota bacterium]